MLGHQKEQLATLLPPHNVARIKDNVTAAQSVTHVQQPLHAMRVRPEYAV